jgi:hypothetical protein
VGVDEASLSNYVSVLVKENSTFIFNDLDVSILPGPLDP